MALNEVLHYTGFKVPHLKDGVHNSNHLIGLCENCINEHSVGRTVSDVPCKKLSLSSVHRSRNRDSEK